MHARERERERERMGRAPCCTKVGLHRGPWTAREDGLLMKYIQAHGEGQWRSLPKNAGLLRCGKSCRLRWVNYLRPNIKRGNITPDEEDLIIRLHSLLGNKWSLIAGRLPGRTDNEIKNYWNTHIIKRLRSHGIDPNPNTQKKKGRSSTTNYANKLGKAQKHNQFQEKEILVESKIENIGTKIHLPKPVRIRSVIPLTRSNSNETNGSTISVTSSQSQHENHGLLFDPENDVMLDMPWLSNNDDDHGLDHVMKDVPHDEVGPSDNAMQLQKLYEEYLRLIKVDHDGDDDHDDHDGDDALLDSLAKSFLI